MMYFNPQETFQKSNKTGISIVYPVRNPFQDNLNNTISPKIGKQHGVPAPTKPNNVGFKEMVDEFLMVRDYVERDKWPANYLKQHYPEDVFPTHPDVPTGEVPEPIRDANVNEINPKGAAQLVRMDAANDLGNFIFDYLVREGVPFRYSDRLERNDFHKGRILFNQMLWNEIEPATKKFFEVKYFYGSARPEEFLGVPGCVLTNYTEGCPRHPSYVAGHGTLAGVTLRVIERFFVLANFLLQKVISAVSCYHFAQYRTLAGVHWTEDNIEGLIFGYRMPFANN